jgi:hypothetical protein
MHRGWVPTLFVAACNFSADPVGIDSPPGSPSTFQISGTTSTVGGSGAMPLGNVSVEAYGQAGLVASTQSAVEGPFSLVVMQVAGGVSYLHATHADYLDSYLFPPQPIAADFSVGSYAILLSPQTLQLVEMLTMVTQQPGKGWIALLIVDNTMTPVGDAVAVASGGQVLYNGTDGLPTSGGQATHSDGVAYVFNAPVGSVEIGALKAGISFRSHTIDVRADLVTLAFVAP